jgi:hypothetical protein
MAMRLGPISCISPLFVQLLNILQIRVEFAAAIRYCFGVKGFQIEGKNYTRRVF